MYLFFNEINLIAAYIVQPTNIIGKPRFERGFCLGLALLKQEIELNYQKRVKILLFTILGLKFKEQTCNQDL